VLVKDVGFGVGVEDVVFGVGLLLLKDG